VLGIRTNIPFLIAILQHPRFVAGTIHTGWLDDEAGRIRDTVANDEIPVAALAAVVAHQGRSTLGTSTFGASTAGTSTSDTSTSGTSTSGTPGTTGTYGTSEIDPFVSLENWRG
jgi:acetyl/propionyl-CoA carboxylase alpha subunit